MIKDGTNFQPRQFERTTVNPGNMQRLALQELTAPPKKRRERRALRIMLPAWLSRRTTRDAEEMEKNMQQTERND